MQGWLELVFWAGAGWCVYTYLLYPVLLWHAGVWAQVRRDWQGGGGEERRRGRRHEDEPPAVSVVIPVHNEAEFLAEKIANLRALDYPAERLEVIFVCDGCSDDSADRLRQAGAGWQVLEVRQQGKCSALNQGVERARHALLVLCDAPTLLARDAIRRLVSHFEDPAVGVVCGAVRFRASQASARTEGVYWRYECLLRVLEARLGATLTASGALYALRREGFEPLAADALIDDFMIPMTARELGYRVVYDASARATDYAAAGVEGEFKRRVRLAVGSFRALGQLWRMPLDPMTRWALVSHKICRWLLPWALLAVLVSSALLAGKGWYGAALIAQLLFYGWAGVGFALRQGPRAPRTAALAYYLTAMNAAFLVGLARVATGQGQPKWR